MKSEKYIDAGTAVVLIFFCFGGPASLFILGLLWLVVNDFFDIPIIDRRE